MRLSRKQVYWLALCFLPAFLGVFSGSASASVSVGVNVNFGPPQIVVAEPPMMVVVPQSRVYFVPEPGIDIFFYAGFWWSPRGGRWYQSRNYNHGWIAVEPARVPSAVIYMPRDYRTRYAYEQPIPYGQWKKDYSRLEKERMEAHKRWEKEREMEWKRQAKNDRYNKYGYNPRDNRYSPPGNRPGGPRPLGPKPPPPRSGPHGRR